MGKYKTNRSRIAYRSQWCREALSGKRISAGGFLWSKELKDKIEIENSEKAFTYKRVVQYSKDGKYIKEYSTITEAAKSVNGDGSAVTKVCKGKRKIAYGYIWKYKE